MPILTAEGGLARGSDATGSASAVQLVLAPPVSQSPASVAVAPTAQRAVMVEPARVARAPKGRASARDYTAHAGAARAH